MRLLENVGAERGAQSLSPSIAKKAYMPPRGFAGSTMPGICASLS